MTHVLFFDGSKLFFPFSKTQVSQVTQVNSGESGGKNRDSRNSGEKRDSDSVTEENSVYRSIQLKFRSEMC